MLLSEKSNRALVHDPPFVRNNYMKTVMSINHPLWETFCDMLNKAAALKYIGLCCEQHWNQFDAKMDMSVAFVSPESHDAAIGCLCNDSFEKTRQVLFALNDALPAGEKVHVGKSLSQFHRDGGHCDCEVVFNICVKTNDPALFAAILSDANCSCGHCDQKAAFLQHQTKRTVSRAA